MVEILHFKSEIKLEKKSCLLLYYLRLVAAIIRAFTHILEKATAVANFGLSVL
jgi:hypothetical protein